MEQRSGLSQMTGVLGVSVEKVWGFLSSFLPLSMLEIQPGQVEGPLAKLCFLDC